MTRNPLDIHLIAIGGTGMAPLACLLKESGHCVQGSDGPLYPPMSTLLEAAGIEPLVGYDPAHLASNPDLVVVGNAVPKTNPEAVEMERLGVARMSMPEALFHFFLKERRPLVIAGTHGKTTTTSLAAWVYSDCQADPGFLIGGIPIDLGRSFQLGSGERFIIEGDEYNASYFDRGPKFLHYKPETLILTSVEYDHADLYPTPESLTSAYEKLVTGVPASGTLIACGDTEELRRVAEKAQCRVIYYGLLDKNDIYPDGPIETQSDGSRFSLLDPEIGPVQIELGLFGEHNISNAIAVWAAARNDGLATDSIVAALRRFRGVKRRLEILGTVRGVTVIDDFAHHPTAVQKTLSGLHARYPERRLITVFEPRTLTAGRSFLFDGYLEALAQADRVFLAPIFHAGRLEDGERLDLDKLADELEKAGTEVEVSSEIESLLRDLVASLADGDVVVTMSSGSFEGLPKRLLDALS